MSIYVVTAYRWGQRNAHSYVVGAFTNKTAAIECAEAHVDYRGGKYGCEVVNALEWTEDADNVAEQVYYSESPYFGKAGDAGHFHAADIKKRCVPSQKPFTVRELQNKVGELERENSALRADAERYRWIKRDNIGVHDVLELFMSYINCDLDKEIDQIRAKEAKTCQCTNGVVRSVGRDNEEIIEDCPNCSPSKETQP